MNIKSLDDILKLHRDFSAVLTEDEKDLRERHGAAGFVVDQLRQMLKQSRAEREAVHRAKSQAEKRFEVEARRQEQAIDQLEHSLEELAKVKRGKRKVDEG
jgi:DNA-binding transcriptional MerR regulator